MASVTAAPAETPDLLYGAKAVAEHLGITPRQFGHLHEEGCLPTFKLGATVCARRSTLAKHFAAQEKQARSLVEAFGSAGRLGGQTVAIGLRAIAERLGVTVPAAGALHAASKLPTYLDGRNRVSAKLDDLDAYLAAEGQ